MSKIEDAISLIKSTISDKSVVLSSFGKDSMVLLDLIKKAGYKLPIVFFKEPFFPEKYIFANQIILKERYTVYDYPPLATGVLKKNGKIEIANFYQLGNQNMFLPTGVIEPKDDDYLCGLEDLINKPTGTFEFPWDTIYMGHKSSDVDPLQGPVPLNTSITKIGIGNVVFPIRFFTDEDIWQYHEDNSLPMHSTRYHNGKELADKTYNPDYFPICTKCLDIDNEPMVLCPLTGRKIRNTAEDYTIDLPRMSYMEGK